MLRDKIVFTLTGILQELLLGEDNLTLDKAVKICRAFERLNRQVKEFRESVTLPSSSSSVNKITQNSDTVKSRIELNKRLHYTPLVSLIVLLLVRSTLSYMQIKSLLS